MGKLKTVLIVILIFGLGALPVGCSDDTATTGTASASATVIATGSATTASVLTPSSTLPVTPPTLLTTPSTGTAVMTVELGKLDLIGAYLVVIDHLIANRNMRIPPFKYLAIDTTKLPNLTPADKARLFQALEKYKLQLLDKTFQQLEAEGYIEKYLVFTNGAWIELKDIRMDGAVITLDAGIHLAGLNGYGLDDMRVSYVGTHWEITRILMTWVA